MFFASCQAFLSCFWRNGITKDHALEVEKHSMEWKSSIWQYMTVYALWQQIMTNDSNATKDANITTAHCHCCARALCLDHDVPQGKDHVARGKAARQQAGPCIDEVGWKALHNLQVIGWDLSQQTGNLKL